MGSGVGWQNLDLVVKKGSGSWERVLVVLGCGSGWLEVVMIGRMWFWLVVSGSDWQDVVLVGRKWF